ncbi:MULTISPECIES: CcdC family protein [Pontibacillus]|uniref:Cytochrome c biogenesis protein CcdC n=1 Tax=Pontibacillus chungwhensis TaxID=265426 RepID=A0ABY8V280_9BACI|nr:MULTISPECIES: cytochrome c biogenesis protein CcdC [Pontibacillus]MCD5322787.1 cytochrome c biogenesis protein CcdC [Pontibacillus sp. HN14]WIG00057.1 cytochrome c biogenesis protein CcdC [Pontibacillus chungwhensis]
MFWAIASTVGAALMATTMIFIRMRASRRPASVKKIILPPFFMSTGAFMFVFEPFRVEWMQVLEAFSVGVFFSLFLIKTSTFEIRKDNIYLKPSKAFVFILFGLLILRIILKLIIGQTVSLGETSGMFFLLAFGMILTWRIAMLFKYLRLRKELPSQVNKKWNASNS